MALPDPHSLAMQTGHAPSQRWVARRKHVVSEIGRPPRNERTRVGALHFLGQRAGLKGGSWDVLFFRMQRGIPFCSCFYVFFLVWGCGCCKGNFWYVFLNMFSFQVRSFFSPRVGYSHHFLLGWSHQFSKRIIRF